MILKGVVTPRLSSLLDVNITSISDGQIIVWDAASGKFKNQNNWAYGVPSSHGTISAQVITAGSTFTQNISLSGSDWTNGWMFLENKAAIQTYFMGAYIAFGTTNNDSQGMSGDFIYTNYTIAASPAVRIFTADGVISGRCFGTQNANTIVVQSARITGTTLELIFKNTGAASQTLDCVYKYQVMRGQRISPP